MQEIFELVSADDVAAWRKYSGKALVETGDHVRVRYRVFVDDLPPEFEPFRPDGGFKFNISGVCDGQGNEIQTQNTGLKATDEAEPDAGRSQSLLADALKRSETARSGQKGGHQKEETADPDQAVGEAGKAISIHNFPSRMGLSKTDRPSPDQFQNDNWNARKSETMDRI